MGVYPNPVVDNLYFQLYILKDAVVDLQLIDMNGAVVYQKQIGPLHNGINNIVIPCDTFATGTYVLKAISNGSVSSMKVIKN
jgi:hypothetical protein